MGGAGVKKEQPVTALGQRMVEVRLGFNLSVRDFALIYGIPRSTILSIENGTRNTSNDTIMLLVAIFGEDLFGEFIEHVRCRYCGKDFVPNRKHVKFCSDSCRNRFANRRGSRLWFQSSLPETLSELAQEEAMAREAGLSYGKYQALKRGFIL